MSEIIIPFCWGFWGSIGAESVRIYCLLTKQGRLPARYKKPIFWISRLAVALLSGSLVVAYEIDQPLLAMHIGAATPVIIGSLESTVPFGLSRSREAN